MFPYADHCPVGGFQGKGIAFVARAIPGDLRLPEVSMYLGHVEMLGTAVPEATINEHCNPVLGKDNVWSGAYPIQSDREIYSVSIAKRVQEMPQFQLGLGVPAAVPLHLCAGGRGARRGRLPTEASHHSRPRDSRRDVEEFPLGAHRRACR